MTAAPTNKVTLCFGVKGQGKSYSIKRSLDKLGRHSPVYVWDPNREYAGDAAHDGIRDAIVYRSWPLFLEHAAAQEGHLGRVVIQVAPERFIAFCKFVHTCGGCTVVLDELHDYAGQESPHGNKLALKLVMTTSRHRRLNVFAAAWRPTDLPTWVRHPADEIRAFNTTEVNDLAWYRPTCGEDFVNRLPTLPPYRPAVWRRGEQVAAPNPKRADPCGSRSS
jgi:hypothetical protein